MPKAGRDPTTPELREQIANLATYAADRADLAHVVPNIPLVDAFLAVERLARELHAALTAVWQLTGQSEGAP